MEEVKFCQEVNKETSNNDSVATAASTIVPIKEARVVIQGPVEIANGFVSVYQVEYSKGSYEDFSCWTSENVYFKKEDAEKELADFLEKNSIENLKKKFKVTDYEYWTDCTRPDYERDLPTIKAKYPNMSEDEIETAYMEDCELYWNYINEYNQYNYKLCQVVEKKLRGSY